MSETGREVVEHGVQMSGGGFHVRCTDPGIERFYPLEQWVEHRVREGNCWRRTIIVVDDWAPVVSPGEQP